ncbi:MAG: hypothetical protein FWH56_02960 [Betaproteobacteria bacterium]|nr:hypothetical protein [Betaproteobacteria bacterium]
MDSSSLAAIRLTCKPTTPAAMLLVGMRWRLTNTRSRLKVPADSDHHVWILRCCAGEVRGDSSLIFVHT